MAGRIMRGLGTAVTVLAIVFASTVGLHEWAEATATRDAFLPPSIGQTEA
jgi:hypothetical protein